MINQLETLVEELLRWNRARNLTAIKSRAEAYEKHLVDSLTLLPQARQAGRLLDLGSGAGFPALPLKIACPHLAVVSVDAVAKKIAFQRHMARVLCLEGFVALHARAEVLPGLPECSAGFDLITARALGSLPLLTALARPCLLKGGRLLAMKGPEGPAELDEHRISLAEQGWRVTHQVLTLPLSGAQRCLIQLARE